VPVPTSAEILDAAAASAAAGVLSATVDGQSATAMNPLDQLKLADAIAAREALAGANAAGGARSGWNRLRPSKAIPPGTTGGVG